MTISPHDYQPRAHLQNGCFAFYTFSPSQSFVSKLFLCCPLVEITFLYLSWKSGVVTLRLFLVISWPSLNALTTDAITRGRRKRTMRGTYYNSIASILTST